MGGVTYYLSQDRILSTYDGTKQKWGQSKLKWSIYGFLKKIDVIDVTIGKHTQ